MTNILLILVGYFLLLWSCERLVRQGMPIILGRKLAHIGAGLISAALPWLIDLTTAVLLGMGWLVLLGISMSGKPWRIFSTQPNHPGVILFPVGLTLNALLFWPIDPLIFQISVLVFSLADPVAGLIGQYFGRFSYRITGKKTLEGSLVFFLAVMAVLGLSVTYLQAGSMKEILLGGLLITLTEGALGKGWDNLVVPPISGLIVYKIFFL